MNQNKPSRVCYSRQNTTRFTTGQPNQCKQVNQSIYQSTNQMECSITVERVPDKAFPENWWAERTTASASISAILSERNLDRLGCRCSDLNGSSCSSPVSPH